MNKKYWVVIIIISILLMVILYWYLNYYYQLAKTPATQGLKETIEKENKDIKSIKLEKPPFIKE